MLYNPKALQPLSDLEDSIAESIAEESVLAANESSVMDLERGAAEASGTYSSDDFDAVDESHSTAYGIMIAYLHVLNSYDSLYILLRKILQGSLLGGKRSRVCRMRKTTTMMMKTIGTE